MIKAGSTKKAKSRARASLKRDKGKRIKDKPVFVTRDRAQWWFPVQTIIAPAINFEAF
jgi:hypothetical protein